MNTQIVRNWMTDHPITITAQITLPETKELMLDYHLRHLPVVDKDKLVGMVTWRDINCAEASLSNTLSPYEMSLVQALMKARKFISTALVTNSSDATIEEAAGLMMEHKISGLPVVDDGKMVGLITETDSCIFAMQLETVA